MYKVGQKFQNTLSKNNSTQQLIAVNDNHYFTGSKSIGTMFTLSVINTGKIIHVPKFRLDKLIEEKTFILI